MFNSKFFVSATSSLRDVFSAASWSVIAYLMTAVVTISTMYLLNIYLDSELKFFLGYYLVLGISIGIEPGYVKSELANTRNLSNISHASIFLNTLLPTIVSIPVLAVLAYILSQDFEQSLGLLINIPVLLLVGLLSNNYRHIFMYLGKNSLAVLIKQINLIIGVAVVGGGQFLGFELSESIAISILLRVVFTFAAVRLLPIPFHRNLNRPTIFNKSSWWHFWSFSVTGSVRGSIDRIVILYLVQDEIAITYFLVYEILSRFWIFPYILSPILFAKVVVSAQSKFLTNSIVSIALYGFIFLFAIIIIIINDLHLTFLNTDVGVALILYMAIAVVLISFSMLITSFLQAVGMAFNISMASVFFLLSSFLIFLVLIQRYGLLGIGLAWLVSALLELIVLLVMMFYREKNGIRKE